MLTVLATLRIRPGTAHAFEEDFRSWAKVIKANEPGTLRYWLSRDPENPETYYALELYADETALQAHMGNLQARTGGIDVLAEPPRIQVLEWVADAHDIG